MTFRHFFFLPFLALPALASEDGVPAGWLSSGWPAALADAACDDDSACWDKLRACGPGDTSCSAGVSYCSLTRGDEHIFESACQTDRSGDAVTAIVPSRVTFEMRFGATPQLDGAPATIPEEDRLHRADTSETVCARPIDQPHTLRAWLKEE